MLKLLQRFLTTAFALFYIIEVIGQQMPMNATYRTLTYRDGLAGTSVTDIISDHKGEMWFATSNGVNSYNGKRLVTHVLDSTKRNNHVYRIYESTDYRIFATSRHGIFCKNYGVDEFQRIIPEISTAETLLPWNNDTLFIGNRDGLHIFDGKKIKTIRVADTPMNMDNSVRDIRKDEDGNVWFVSKCALNVLNPSTGKIKSIPITLRMPNGASLSRMNIVDNIVYIGTKNDGLYRYDLKNDAIKQIEGVGNVVTSIKNTNKDVLCVSTDGAGAYLIEVSSGDIIQHFQTNKDSSDGIISNAVYCYYRDDKNVDWFGYFRFGATHTFHVENLFQPYRYKNFTTEGLSVRSFCIDTNYHLIGVTNGFYFIDLQRDLVRHIQPKHLGDGHIVTSMVRYGNFYYIGTYDGGLHRFDPVSMTVSNIDGVYNFNHLSVSKLVVNPLNNMLYIATSQGLFVYGSDGTIAHFNEANSKLGGGNIYDISQDVKGNIWLSSPSGLTFYDMKTLQFQTQGFPKGFFNTEPGLIGCQGHDGRHFFYNNTDVFYTDSCLQHFGRIGLPEILQKGLILSFADDKNGHYWASNEHGLYRFDYNLKHMQYYSEGEGLNCQIITDGSLHIDSLGYLWMGTSNGLLYTKLNTLEKWQHQVRHNILLYQIRLGGELLPDSEESVVNDRNKLTLKWNFTSETFQATPVVTDYSHSTNRIFEYRIDNQDDWSLISEDMPLKINGLMIGHHTISIRLSGLQNTEKIYNLMVLPSWVAILEMVLLVIIIILLKWWHTYRRNTKLLLHERDCIEEALVEMEQAHERQEQAMERQKYGRVRVNKAECEEIVRRMRKYIETEKPYRNPDLKMSDLAEVMQLSSSKLSQVFNLYLNENYYVFINSYRLDEFKRRIEAGDAERFTILAISEQCGFKKSSFFATFRRVEGMTPAEYLKKKH